MERVGGAIFDHLHMIEYYRYLKEYDESCISIFRFPKPFQPEGQTEPVLSISFIKAWEKKYAKEHTKDWGLEQPKCDRIKRAKFAELFSKHRINYGAVNDQEFSTPFFLSLIHI